MNWRWLLSQARGWVEGGICCEQVISVPKGKKDWRTPGVNWRDEFE
jgi:hypothetical protein